MPLVSQNASQHSLYMIDIYNHNVAYGGFDRSLSANFNYRNQWSGLPGNPEQFYVNAHLPVYLLNGGAGFSFYTDRAGALRKTGFMISFNRVRSFRGGIFSFGGSLGLRQTAIDGSVIRTPEGIYQGGFSHEDPILGINTDTGTSPSWSLAFYTATDFFDFGISVNDLFVNQVTLDQINFEQSRGIDIYSAIPFLVSDLEIQTSLYIKTNLQQTQGELSAMAKNGNVFGGVSLRGFNENSFDSVVFFGGIKLNEHYTLSYSYDAGISALSDSTQGSHEININYNLNKLIGIGLPPEIIYNPRNL